MFRVVFHRVAMLLLLMAMTGGCDDGHRPESLHKSAPASHGASQPEAKIQMKPGMSENDALKRMKEMGYIAAPVQDYPSSGGGGISVYMPTGAGKRDKLLVVEWRGPSGYRSVRSHAVIDAEGRDASIPFEKLRELLHKDENSGR